MDVDKLNQCAEALAMCAVKGERSSLEKIAADYQKQAVIDMETLKGYMSNPYVRNSLIGAGAGGLLGMLQPKRKGRNALTYGLIGGLGGLGSAALLNQFGGKAPDQAAPGAAPGAAPAAAPGAAQPTLEEAKKNLDAAGAKVQNEQANPYLYSGGGAVGGGVAGVGLGRMMGEGAGELASRALGHLRGRGNEIGALTNATNLPRGDQAVAQGIQQLQDRFRRAPGNAGNVASFADDLATSPNPGVQAAVQRNLGPAAATPMQPQQSAQQLARNVERIVNRGRLPIFGRAQAARQLSQAQDLIEAQRLAANPPRRGGVIPPTATALGEQQILDALNNARTRTPVMPRFLPRAGGVLGGLGLGAAGAYGGYRAGGGYADYINNPLFKAYDQADAAYRAAGGK
jgi:hypothetical protein